MPWRATVLTLFPQMFPGPLGHSLAGRGLTSKIWSLNALDIRDFSTHPHRSVDDTCYGGGTGMLMRPDVIHSGLIHALSLYESPPRIIYLTPRGEPLTQKKVRDLVKHTEGCILLCGRYEGVDERVIEYWKTHHGLEEISIGDYILSGGEIPALALLDACVRLLPGIVVKEEATIQESFDLDLLEFPQYTKPQVWKEIFVPDVLLSGHHKAIRTWKHEQSKQITQERRPDLRHKKDD